MRFVSLLYLASAVVALAVPEAVPAEVIEDDGGGDLEARDLIGVHLCKETNYVDCTYYGEVQSQNMCFKLSNTFLDNKLRGFKVGAGYRCRFWESKKCDGDSTGDISSPGAAEFPSNMRDRISSLKCYIGSG